MAVTILVGGALLFSVWQLASMPLAPDTEKLQSDVAFLASDLEAVRIRLQRMQARQEVLQQEADILRQANRLLQEQESARQAEFGQLQSELDFYRRLVGAGAVQEGLDAFDMKVMPTGSGRVFRFILTLTQNIRNARIIEGLVGITLEGTHDDRPVTLEWVDMNETGTGPPVFQFKYFQQLDGYLALPKGFSPTRLLVHLDAAGSRSSVLKSYAWKDILDSNPGDD